MALIKQVKVGGVTYDIAMKAGHGIEINGSGVVSAKLGSGLYIGASGEICASGFIAGVGSGLTTQNGPLELMLGSGLTTQNGLLELELMLGSGLTTQNGLLELKLGTGLVIDAYGNIDIRN